MPLLRYALSAAAVLSIGVAASPAIAMPANCTVWGGPVSWAGTAYAVATARLYQQVGSTAILVETSTDDALWTTPGTQTLSGSWTTTSLNGTFFAIIDGTFYGGLDHYPTPAELASWPAARTYHVSNTTPPFSCTGTPPPPPPPVCGDGVIGGGEQCDDGNTINGDGCSATCTFEPPPPPPPVCGNGVLNTGEECDDGNTVSGDGCSATCGLEGPGGECGNGVVEPGEECDDGNQNGGDGCNSDCIFEELGPRCGDGVISGSEQCDDGNTNNGDGCDTRCMIEAPPAQCGNGVVEYYGGEQCDDGNQVDGDGCNSDCQAEAPPPPVCGDGVVNQSSEQCDDGNTVNGDGCSSTCTTEGPTGCTRTIGYWKTHNAVATNASQQINWPLSENTAICGRTWLAALNEAPRGNALIILAHQLIGARLNVAAGASTSPAIDAAMARAQELIGDCVVARTERTEATDLAGILDAFNNGNAVTPHCQ